MSGAELSLPPGLAARAAAELAPEEKLVWVGQPRPGLAVRPAFVLVPFGLVLVGFAVCWMGMIAAAGGVIVAPCGLPFVAVGVALVASPVWLRCWARNTLYALTDRRAVIWQPGLFGTVAVRSYTAAGLGVITRFERADASGDLVFEEVTPFANTAKGPRSTTTRIGFLGVDGVRAVEDLVRRTLLGGRR
jgi:hypothetical protein